MSLWTFAFCTSLACLAGLLAYGIVSADLLHQEIWSPEGLRKLIWLACSYGVVTSGLIAWKPRWFRPLVLGASLAYTALAAGLAALGAVVLCLASAYVLGRLILHRSAGALDELLSLLLGLSVIATMIGLAVHVRVNYASVYVIAFLIPLLAQPRLTVECGRRIVALLRPVATAGRAETAAQALLVFVLIAHWLIVLKPEAGTDGLAMHLAIPEWVAQHHFWNFDFRHLVWAVMPMAGDWIYTAVFLPGGEHAARLLNFAMLCWLAGFLFNVVRQWATPVAAYLATALFCSSPIVQLETGTLFVENFWAALLAGSLAALWRFHKIRAVRYVVISGVLLGTAMQTKIGALAFFLPVAALACWELTRSGLQRRLRGGALALLAFVLFAAPPYVNGYLKTANPVFPFANAIFQSPYFESGDSFADLRFNTPLAWDTLYSVTVHTDRFLESQKGALGFHYLLLLPLLLLIVRRKWPIEAWTAIGASLAFFLVTFGSHPNIRYIYPVLALATVGIGWLFASAQKQGGTAYSAIISAALCGILLNVYFLPASGWYHKDFFISPVSVDSRRDYLARTAPVRLLVDYINLNHPGAPVMLIESSDIAGVRGPVYSNRWHTHTFRRELLKAQDAGDVLRLVNRHEIRYFIAPAEASGIVVAEPVLQSFLTEFTAPEHTAASYYVAKLGSKYTGAAAAARIVQGLMPVPPGRYDDSGARVSFSGRWYRDPQFARAANRTLTYSDTPGDSFRLTFTGARITYFYTRAPNRGIAEIFIDGESRMKLDMYGSTTEWQASTILSGLAAGQHQIEVRITTEKNPLSSGNFVDVDSLVVE